MGHDSFIWDMTHHPDIVKKQTFVFCQPMYSAPRYHTCIFTSYVHVGGSHVEHHRLLRSRVAARYINIFDEYIRGKPE